MSDVGQKRKAPDDSDLLQGTSVVIAESDPHQQMVLKKQRTESEQSLVASNAANQQLTLSESNNQAPPRTSTLPAATMCLTGHGAAVLTCAFNNDGTYLASGGVDKNILLWNLIANESVQNTSMLSGHEAPILDLDWSADGSTLFSASADKFAAVWDVETETRIKRIKYHTASVNSCSVTRRGRSLLLTASDDHSARINDLRSRHAQSTFVDHTPILDACWSDDATQIFTAGISNDIKCFDVRTNKLLFSLIGHRDTVTGIALSPDGSFLLSNSMDCSLRLWDVRPYVSTPTRCVNLFKGNTHDMQQNLLRCSWSKDGTKVSAGSADQTVNVWDVNSAALLWKLPGHKAVVNEVAFHPKEPIIASCSSDKTVWLGEL